MALFPPEILDEILNRTDIVSLISDHVTLKKSGKEYKGLCPFHQEKTPSFMVNPEKRIYHCFGCGQGGNAYRFLMTIENLPFPEAAEKLAKRGGIDLTSYQGTDVKKDEREVLYKINRYAAWFFRENLKTSKKCRDYLAKRKIHPAAEEEFQLGCAPDSWESLAHFLASKKVPLVQAETAGLIRKRQDGSHYDFFRDRLMFPIIDAEGRIAAFSGRRLDDKKEEAKYVNSPESVVYKKGQCVYGLFQAKKAIREKNEVVLVEGNIDLVRLWQSGLKNVAAPLGTALTQAQIKLLARYAEKFVLLFDGDSAGLRAFEKALLLMLGLGFHPRVVRLPNGDDPDGFVEKRGIEALSRLIAEAPPSVEGLMIEAFSKAGPKTSERVEAVRKFLPLVEQIQDDLEKKAYLARLSRFLGMPEGSLEATVALPRKDAAAKRALVENQKNSLERILLRLYVTNPQIAHEVLGKGIFGRFADIKLKTLGLKLVEYYGRHGALELDKILDSENAGDTDCLTEFAFGDEAEGEAASFRTVLKDCLCQWKKQCLKAELSEITGAIHLAELRGDRDSLTRLLVRKNEAIRDLKP
ncbi:MAG: DNA primase [Elusimicrobia bacterium]|nr:DNA primase [Elusimicrobiota bacterium]